VRKCDARRRFDTGRAPVVTSLTILVTNELRVLLFAGFDNERRAADQHPEHHRGAEVEAEQYRNRRVFRRDDSGEPERTDAPPAAGGAHRGRADHPAEAAQPRQGQQRKTESPQRTDVQPENWEKRTQPKIRIAEGARKAEGEPRQKGDGEPHGDQDAGARKGDRRQGEEAAGEHQRRQKRRRQSDQQGVSTGANEAEEQERLQVNKHLSRFCMQMNEFTHFRFI
jgi:flagellar biosynthesis/type III secretory pathway protein FliH